MPENVLEFLESVRHGPSMAIFSVFLDESGKKSDNPVTALSAVCATRGKIAEFDFNWRHLLRHFGIAEFHMVEASRLSQKWGNLPPQKLEERIENLKPFAECILEYLELGFLTAWDILGGLRSYRRPPDA